MDMGWRRLPSSVSAVKPADRIDVINRCAAALDGRRWAEIDFILEQFGLPTANVWGGDSQFDYVRSMLADRGGDDNDLLELRDYLVGGGAAHTTEDEPWELPTGRLFVTHLATHKATAEAVKVALAGWGLDGFVAHRDIDPGREWARVIIAALNTCDALVALLHKGIKESDWCDQEIGVALGRGIPVIPVRIEMDPYGLAGIFQALPWVGESPATTCAVNVVDVLLNDKRTNEVTIEAMVAGLEHATYFDMANRIALKLAPWSGALLPVSAEQVERLRRAYTDNSQVRDAWHTDGAISRLERTYVRPPAPPTTAVGYGFDEEPF
jgi:hypothetical protein